MHTTQTIAPPFRRMNKKFIIFFSPTVKATIVMPPVVRNENGSLSLALPLFHTHIHTPGSEGLRFRLQKQQRQICK